MIKTLSFKLYNSSKNKRLDDQVNLASWIYNHCVALHRRYYGFYKISLKKGILQKHITKLKKTERYKHWNDLNSQAIQDIAERIERAYTLFYSNLRRKVRCSPPNFKKRSRYKSFTLKQTGYKFLYGNIVYIMGSKYRFFKSRELEGQIKTVTVKRDTIGDFYIFVVCESDNVFKPNKVRSGKSVGFDFGLKTYLTASDGCSVESPLFFKQGQNRLKKLGRALSLKKKGSKNRRKAKLNLAKEHIRVANRRKDFQYKLAKRICLEYDTVCLEDLNLKAMQRLWGKKVSDLGHGGFVKILEQQAVKYDVKVVKIDRFYPSSKTCSVCGGVNKELSLKDRVWKCSDCGTTHDRDLNAAINIYKAGTSAFNGASRRPCCLASGCDVRIPVL
jgi:putative transposase